MKKQIVVSALVLLVAGSGLFVTHTYAEDGTNDSDTLVQKISDTFKLNKTDVQKVFTEHRSEHMAKMQEKMGERLGTLVSEGKITEAQKTLILNKQKELQEKMKNGRETMKNMTPEERKAAMQKERQELEAWAKQNGIDLQYLMPVRHMGIKRMK